MTLPIRGTPKSLSEAIKNGLADARISTANDSGLDEVEIIKAHVVDYLSQRFCTAMIKTMTTEIESLWNEIKK